jgi:hypothetical protein
MGKTFATIEAMVATKIMAECQAGALNPDGGKLPEPGRNECYKN